MYIMFTRAGKTYRAKVINQDQHTRIVTATYLHNGRELITDLKPTQYTETTPPPPKEKRAPNTRRLNRYIPQHMAPMEKTTTDGAKYAPTYPKGADDAQRAAVDARHEQQKKIRQLLERRARRRAAIAKAKEARRRLKIRRGLITPPKFRTMTRAEIIALQRAAILAGMTEEQRANLRAKRPNPVR